MPILLKLKGLDVGLQGASGACANCPQNKMAGPGAARGMRGVWQFLHDREGRTWGCKGHEGLVPAGKAGMHSRLQLRQLGGCLAASQEAWNVLLQVADHSRQPG